MTPKFCIVYKCDIKVLEDYLNSWGNLIDKRIEIDDFNLQKFIDSNHIYIFTQMWMDIDTTNEILLKSPRFMFLNVEMLTEQTRLDQMIKFLRKDIHIIDYSEANVKWLCRAIVYYKINYTKKILWFPYQFNKDENDILSIPYKNNTDYKYDVGIINAHVKTDPSVHSSNTYKRNRIWEKLKEHSSIKALNIMGWGKERDLLINKCRIILNIHHFECYNIFENIRCDRLIFANKFIVTERSDFEDELDISDFVLKVDYEDIIKTVLNLSPKNKNLKTKHFLTKNELDKKEDIINNRKLVMKINLEYLSNLLK